MIPSPPLDDPQAIYMPSIEISREITIPSCLASKKNSLKSNGHTLKYLSSLPVTQNPGFIERLQIDPSCVL